MKKEDQSIFAYRMQKEALYTDIVRNERMKHDYVRNSVYTNTCGWVDYSIYEPFQRKGKVPAVFMFHGGGFVLGYYEQEGRYCRKLADETGCALINVDYPLAPEFKFPDPLYGTYEALTEILGQNPQLDQNKVIVMGNSSGGCIALDMSLLNRKRKKFSIIGEILDYAPLDEKPDQSERTTSDRNGSVAPSRAVQYIHWYLKSEADFEDPLASPARCADLRGLPSTLVIEAELDSLHKEEQLFAKRAVEAGVPVEEHLFKNCGHGFTHPFFANYREKEADQAWKLMASFIRKIK